MEDEGDPNAESDAWMGGDRFADDLTDDDLSLYDYDTYVEEDSQTLEDTLLHCVLPSVQSIVGPLARILGSCIFLRLCAQTGIVSPAVSNLMSATVGFWLVYTFFQAKMAYMVVFAFMVYVGLCLQTIRCRATPVSHGSVAVTITVAYLIICEVFVVDDKSWHTIRGAQMILAMKTISVAIDVDTKRIPDMPSASLFAGYCLSPSTVIFGPWISYNAYLQLLHNPQTGWRWISRSLFTFLLGIFFLTVSTCWTHYVFNRDWLEDSWQWMQAYRDALSYRSSHYFVSFLSEATCTIAGIPSVVRVAEVQHVELPRSLVEVVTHWNIPMHFWLKTYVFKVFRRFGNFVAIIATYAASSLLHGLNFQLASVLLSLGVYTYVEYVLRQKLARVYSSCIHAKRCREHCGHVYKRSHFGVMLTNFCFGVLALLHLTYLGLMFDSSPSIEETGYSMMHTLKKWGQLSFASHWIVLATYVFHVLL